LIILSFSAQTMALLWKRMLPTYLVLAFHAQVSAQIVTCGAKGTCSCPSTTKFADETCVLHCATEGQCKETTLRCRAGHPCEVHCDAESACSTGTVVISNKASALTITCSVGACSDDMDVRVGESDCALRWVLAADSNSKSAPTDHIAIIMALSMLLGVAALCTVLLGVALFHKKLPAQPNLATRSSTPRENCYEREEEPIRFEFKSLPFDQAVIEATIDTKSRSAHNTFSWDTMSIQDNSTHDNTTQHNVRTTQDTSSCSRIC